MNPFKLLEKKKAPTFLDTAFGNSVLRFLNAIIKLQVAPAGAGKLVVSNDRIVLDLTAMSAAAQAAEIAKLKATVATLQGQVNAINTALKSATITCEGGSVVLVLKKLP